MLLYHWAYVPPKYQPAVHQVDQALAHGPVKLEALLVRNLNNSLAQPQDQCKETLPIDIANYGLMYQTLHFIPRVRYRDEGSLLMENVKIWEAHYDQGGINYRLGLYRLLQSMHQGSKGVNGPPDDPGITQWGRVK